MIDNVIVFQGLIHSFKCKQGHKGAMVLKPDLAKAYDRLEWPFIQETLIVAGLSTNLVVVVVVKCIISGYCKVLWNGEEIDPIHPSRGLRHGDPSPLTFSYSVWSVLLSGLSLRSILMTAAHSKLLDED